ncbi:protein spaetzle 4 [Neodiprion virginianus]|uniref:protein spaetzle 4 n=1 Tax=Neodiprion virginianus TaxID=2961670 RepID=UPI001EE6AE96|nr:protein spaetzle 4 [Neodiprion virginianus]
MRIFILLVFSVLKLQLSRCQSFRGGSSGNFGYDASSACSRPYSRSARARFENLPCDFRHQNWCTVPGSAYPWHAVRRFVQENQGLMRRMYGDERHISVLRAEIDNNDVTEADIDDEFFQPVDDSTYFEDEDDYEEFEDEDQESAAEFEDRSFTSRAFDDSSGRRRFSKFPKLGDYSRPQFRPTSTRTTAKLTTNDSTTKTPVTKTEEETINNSTDQQNATIVEKTTTPVVTLAQIANVQNLSINEIPDKQPDNLDVKSENLTDLPETVKTTTERMTSEMEVTTDLPTTVMVDPLDVELGDEPARNNPNKGPGIEQLFAATEQHFRPRPEYRPPEVRPGTASPNVGGQLFQDVAAKDQAPPILRPRGVNACPVKEEVVAPFWANNTRGEVLALLNLYPFEQYVHWEKCTNENKQMHCRDGCRCEQQFRLHRLLAYDPNNECRGIFSDWFKFPSCCVCRCYDLPVEFRVTSRSPRAQKPRRKTKNQMPSQWYTH